jgi:ribosomal protein S12 methylthiotransferase accessory factor
VRVFGEVHAARKGHTDGTHRVRPPRETVEACRPLMPALGITRLANVTGLDDIGIPVFVAIRPNARSLATSQGKGLDPDAARASALMESIETWHAEHLDLPVRWESHAALDRAARRGGDAVIDPADLACDREPARGAPRAWVRGFDLVEEVACWVPLDAVTLNFVGTRRDGTDLCRSSNGLASGNHILEAIVHGLCEVIERDAEALWRIDAALHPVELTTVTDRGCREVVARLERAGVQAAAWDLTSDVGVPVYGAAVLERPDPARLRSMGIHHGFGCHLAPEVALARALTEAVQTRLTYVSGSRDDLLRTDYEQNRDPEVAAAIWNEVASTPPTATLDRHPSRATPTFEGDLRVLLAAVRGVGIERVAVVDLTRPAFGLPVVKVVVPGLEGPGGLPGARARRIIEQAAAG